MLSTLLVMAARGRSRRSTTRRWTRGTVLHFVDIVWIYLFPLLYLIRGRDGEDHEHVVPIRIYAVIFATLLL